MRLSSAKELKHTENVLDFWGCLFFLEVMYVAGGRRNKCTSDMIKVFFYFESCLRRIQLSERAEEVRHQLTDWRENETKQEVKGDVQRYMV